jgi:YbbR domain-containing protein
MTQPDRSSAGLGLARNWQLKLLALGVAIALWLFVASGETSERSITTPVDYVRVPPGLVVAGTPPASVLVQLRGRRAALARVSPADMRVEVNLSGASAGPTSVRVPPEALRIPRGVTVTSVTPPRVELTLARTVDATAAPDDKGVEGVAMDTEQSR